MSDANQKRPPYPSPPGSLNPPGDPNQPENQYQPGNPYQQASPYQQGSPYQPASPYQPGYQAQPKNGFGVTGLVVGIVCLVLAWFPGLNFVLAVIATVFGSLGWRQANRGIATNKGVAIAGFVMGVIGLALSIGLLIAVGMAMPGSTNY